MEESKLLPIPYNYWKYHTSMESYFYRGLLEIFIQFAGFKDMDEVIDHYRFHEEDIHMVDPSFLSMNYMISPYFGVDKIVNGSILRMLEDSSFGSEYTINWCAFLHDYLDKLLETDPDKIMYNKIQSQYSINPLAFVRYDMNSPIIHHAIGIIINYIEEHMYSRVDSWKHYMESNQEPYIAIVYNIIDSAKSFNNIDLSFDKAFILYLLNKTSCDSIYNMRDTKLGSIFDYKSFDWYQFCAAKFINRRIF